MKTADLVLIGGAGLLAYLFLSSSANAAAQGQYSQNQGQGNQNYGQGYGYQSSQAPGYAGYGQNQGYAPQYESYNPGAYAALPPVTPPQVITSPSPVTQVPSTPYTPQSPLVSVTQQPPMAPSTYKSYVPALRTLIHPLQRATLGPLPAIIGQGPSAAPVYGSSVGYGIFDIGGQYSQSMSPAGGFGVAGFRR